MFATDEHSTAPQSEATVKTVLITRPKAQAAELVEALSRLGWRCELFPTIEIRPLGAWLAMPPSLGDYDSIIFTSANAVEHFLGPLQQIKSNEQRALQYAAIYAIGEKTKAALEKFGITTAVVPQQSSAEGLCALLRQGGVTGKKFLFVRGRSARRLIPACIAEMGGICEECEVYETVKPETGDCDRIRTLIADGKINVVAFASPSAARHFFKLCGTVAPSTKLAAIGETTA
ncbi:MAG: uroporphyrinogen-III synthase [Chloroherpetonaceae bacterium]|nr:uroporphyrinogen-III synthase [Chloroherpetonaceae bacterium]